MKPIIYCCVCGEYKKEFSKKMCRSCYNKQYTPPLAICINCGYEKPHHAHGLCHSCYNSNLINKLIKCKVCGKYKPHNSKGMCQSCYQSDRAYKTTSRRPMYENKKCAAYLGIYVAERVLSAVFKNVNRMPNGNKGYDFICNSGCKIDVKSCVDRSAKLGISHWAFGIKQNKIADYFLCLAFDNRIDLNPIHLWLIPSEIVNNLHGLIISDTNINNFVDYEKSIEDVIICCDELK